MLAGRPTELHSVLAATIAAELIGRAVRDVFTARPTCGLVRADLDGWCWQKDLQRDERARCHRRLLRRPELISGTFVRAARPLTST